MYLKTVVVWILVAGIVIAGCQPPSECGDGVCGDNETPLTCLQDCPTTCGDGYCLGDENAVNCPDDCGDSFSGNSFYSFVWYAGSLEDNLRVMQSLGTDTILSEGPGVLSRSVHWGRATRENPISGQYDNATRNYGDTAWISQAKAAGIEVLLSINTGQNSSKGAFYTPWVECGEPLCGGLGAGFLADCPPSATNWQHWYDFVFDVVVHFDGSTADRPEVRYFFSRIEAASPYWSGTKEQLLGHIDPDPQEDMVSIVRTMPDRSTQEAQLDKALASVAYQALQDANAYRLLPNAEFVLGVPAVFFQLQELYDALEAYAQDGYSTTEKQAITDIALSSNFYANLNQTCIPGTDDYSADSCFDAVSAFFAARDYLSCHLEVGGHALKLSEHYDHISVRCGEGRPLYEPTGDIGYIRAMHYLGGRLPAGKFIWDLGTVGTPSGMPEAELEQYLARDMFKRLIGAYRTEVMHFGPTWLYAPIPLADETICLYRTEGDIPWAVRHEEADVLAKLVKIVPTGQVVQQGASSYLYGPNGWETWAPGENLWQKQGNNIIFGDAVLFSFDVQRSAVDGGPDGRMAAGWCLDKTPWDPVIFEGICPTVDIAQILEIPVNTSVALHTANGQISSIVDSGDPSAVMVTFGQDPILITWGGEDSDGDGIADVSDNCPALSNPDQAENSAEGFESSKDDAVWITAPDGIGDACDTCSDITNPNQSDNSDTCVNGTRITY